MWLHTSRYESRGQEKKEKKQNPSIFLATCWNLSYRSGDLKKRFSKSGEFGLFFLPLKSLCVLGPNQILEVELLARIR
jgi:hypothetical protein